MAEKRSQPDETGVPSEKESPKKVKVNPNLPSTSIPTLNSNNQLNLTESHQQDEQETEELRFFLNNEYRFQFIWKFPSRKIVKKVIDHPKSEEEGPSLKHFDYEQQTCPHLYHEQQIDENNKLMIEI